MGGGGGGGGGGGKKTNRERGRIFRERNSSVSLKFPEIGLSNPGEPRDKVAPYGKSYAWILVLWSFEKLMKVGVFSYLC